MQGRWLGEWPGAWFGDGAESAPGFFTALAISSSAAQATLTDANAAEPTAGGGAGGWWNFLTKTPKRKRLEREREFPALI
jgi:hypothetical protein